MIPAANYCAEKRPKQKANMQIEQFCNQRRTVSSVVAFLFLLLSKSTWAMTSMPFGPNNNETIFLFTIPLVGAGLVSLCMMFSMRAFFALIGALVVWVLWFFLSIGSMQSGVGIIMLLLSPWAGFVFIVFAFFVSRNTESKEQLGQPEKSMRLKDSLTIADVADE